MGLQITHILIIMDGICITDAGRKQSELHIMVQYFSPDLRSHVSLIERWIFIKWSSWRRPRRLPRWRPNNHYSCQLDACVCIAQIVRAISNKSAFENKWLRISILSAAHAVIDSTSPRHGSIEELVLMNILLKYFSVQSHTFARLVTNGWEEENTTEFLNTFHLILIKIILMTTKS